MMCLSYLLYGFSSPSGGPRCCCDNSCAKKGLPCCRRLRRLRRHRHHCRRRCFCCAAAAAVLLLSCCCAAAVVTYGCLISVFLKKYAVLRDANRSSLFSIRDLYFLWSHGISAIRSSQTQLVKVMLEWIWPFSSSTELLVELFLSHSNIRFSTHRIYTWHHTLQKIKYTSYSTLNHTGMSCTYTMVGTEWCHTIVGFFIHVILC